MSFCPSFPTPNNPASAWSFPLGVDFPAKPLPLLPERFQHVIDERSFVFEPLDAYRQVRRVRPRGERDGAEGVWIREP